MSNSSNCPVFVDGQKVCEATGASYSVHSPVEYRGSGVPGTPTVVEQDPPEYTIEIDLPGETYLPIDHESRVEVAIPPSAHGDVGWHVIEVWEINQFEQHEHEASLSAWQGHIHTDVEYLGDDTKVATEERGLTSEDEQAVESDADFEADVHDI